MQMYVKSFFSIDDEIKVEGYHDCSQEWNGFSCPLFEKDEIVKWLMATQKSEQILGFDEVITFEELPWDELLVVCPGGQDWPEHYEAMTVEGVEEKLYAVGAFCWCWQEVPSTEEGPEY